MTEDRFSVHGSQGMAHHGQEFGQCRKIISFDFGKIQQISKILSSGFCHLSSDIPRLPALQRLRLKSIIGTIVG